MDRKNRAGNIKDVEGVSKMIMKYTTGSNKPYIGHTKSSREYKMTIGAA